MCSRLCAKVHADTKVQNRNFWILGKIDLFARTTNKIPLNSFVTTFSMKTILW